MDEPVLNLDGVVLSPQKEVVRVFYKEMWDNADKRLFPSILHPRLSVTSAFRLLPTIMSEARWQLSS